MSLQLITMKGWDIFISHNIPITHNTLEIAF